MLDAANEVLTFVVLGYEAALVDPAVVYGASVGGVKLPVYTAVPFTILKLEM